MPYIDVIGGDDATGELAEVYAEITEKRGRLSQVLMIQSLNPQSIRDHLNLYMTVMFSRSPLKRAQRELIAVIVSLANDCPYCITQFEDSRLALKDSEVIQIKDITEILQEVV